MGSHSPARRAPHAQFEVCRFPFPRSFFRRRRMCPALFRGRMRGRMPIERLSVSIQATCVAAIRLPFNEPKYRLARRTTIKNDLIPVRQRLGWRWLFFHIASCTLFHGGGCAFHQGSSAGIRTTSSLNLGVASQTPYMTSMRAHQIVRPRLCRLHPVRIRPEVRALCAWPAA